jgi:glycosyltransferase involved in cell wall biosynthesis
VIPPHPVPPGEIPDRGRVDIVLATFERPHTIRYSIDAVLRQTYPHFHLHVVGDGCSEETERVVRKVDDARVSFQRFPKARGFGYANRNAVLRRSSAPFVAYATDDDLWFPDHLERAIGALSAGPLDLVAFRSCLVRHPDTLDLHFFALDWSRALGVTVLRDWFTGAVTLVHRRALFEQVGYWDDRLFRFGDREFYNRVRTCGRPFAFIDTPTVLRFYAQHWNSRYPALAEPPQRKYLDRLGMAEWRDGVRRESDAPRRSWQTRRQQCSDFMRFSFRSGPRFVRFWAERLARPMSGSQRTA